MKGYPVEESTLQEINKSLAILSHTTLDKSINSLLRQAEEIRTSFQDDIEVETHLDNIKRKIALDEIDNNSIHEAYWRIHFENVKNPENQLLECAELGLIYTQISITLKGHKDASNCWVSIAKANYYFGMTLGLFNQIESTNKRRASAGGKKKAELNNTIKATLIRLLTEHRPPEGWKSPIKTAEHLIEDLKESLSKSGISLIPNDIELTSTLTNMMFDDKQVKSAHSPK